MEARVGALEAALAQAAAEVARLNGQVGQAQAEAQAATAAAQAAQAQPDGAEERGGGRPQQRGRSNFGIDTRMLGRPEIFTGEEQRWSDWSTVLKAYAGLCDAALVDAMPRVEAAPAEGVNADLQPGERDASVALFYMLVLLTRNEALNIVINSGTGEGLLAWRRLVQRFDSSAATRLAGLLLSLMNWGFGGDIQSRLELFERELLRYEARAGESVSLNQRVGMVLNGLDKGTLKDHLLLNSMRYGSWQEFKSEIINYRRATASLTATSGEQPTPMDIGAFASGPGGRKGGGKNPAADAVCHNCGKKGHFKRDCRQPARSSAASTSSTSSFGRGGAAASTGSGGRSGKGSGGGVGAGRGGGGKGGGITCFRCGGRGHTKAQCPSRVNALDDEGANEQDTEHECQDGAGESGDVDGLFLNMLALGRGDGAREHRGAQGGGIKHEIGVDSCAAASVMPLSGRDSFPQVPLQQDGRGGVYYTASREPIPDEGFKTIRGQVSGSSREINMQFRVAPVHRMLLAMSEMVDQGHRVVFDRTSEGDCSHIVVKSTGERIPLVRRRKVYVIDIGVAGGVGGAESRGFPRPGARL